MKSLSKASQGRKYSKKISSAGEVILFKIPASECSLFVGKLNPFATEEELWAEFEKFGLLFELKIYDVHRKENKEYNYAFVRYYSTWATFMAKKHLNGHVFGGTRCKVLSVRSKNNRKKQPALPLQKSIELINFFIGFDGWSSGILQVQPAEVMTFDETTSLYKSIFKCVLYVRFRHDRTRTLTAVGFGEHEDKSQGTAIEFSKKKAVTEAYKNIFARIALVVLASGKVTIHHLDSRVDDIWGHPSHKEEWLVGEKKMDVINNMCREGPPNE